MRQWMTVNPHLTPAAGWQQVSLRLPEVTWIFLIFKTLKTKREENNYIVFNGLTLVVKNRRRKRAVLLCVEEEGMVRLVLMAFKQVQNRPPLPKNKKLKTQCLTSALLIPLYSHEHLQHERASKAAAS